MSIVPNTIDSTEAVRRVAKLATDIQHTKETIGSLRAAGHITSDAEKHLGKITEDLERWKWVTH